MPRPNPVRHTSRALLWLVAVPLASACTLGAFPTRYNGDAAATGDTTQPDANRADSGTRTDARPGADVTPPRNTGVVWINEDFYNEPTVTQLSAGANFGPGVGIGGQPCTELVASAGCTAYSCNNRPSQTTPQTNAGIIALRLDSTNVFVLMPDASGGYPRPTSNATPWPNARPFTATASSPPDGGAPAFDLAVETPERVYLRTPVLNTGSDTPVPRNVTFPVQWTTSVNATPEANVNALLISAPDPVDNSFVAVSCRAQIKTGQINVPPELMMRLPVGQAIFQLTSYAEATRTSGDWALRFELRRLARVNNGTMAARANLTLQ